MIKKKKVSYKAAALLFRMASHYLVLSSFLKNRSKNIEIMVGSRDEGISILASNPNLYVICVASRCMFEGDDFVSCDPWLKFLAPLKKLGMEKKARWC